MTFIGEFAIDANRPESSGAAIASKGDALNISPNAAYVDATFVLAEYREIASDSTRSIQVALAELYKIGKALFD